MSQSLEERVAYLEGKVEEQTRGFGDLTTRISGLSMRIDALDQKVDRLSARMDSRFDISDAKMSRQFLWLVGLQMATVLAIIGALLQN